MNKLIIFGASGRVGTRLIEYALSDKYKVTAFVRDRSKIKLTDSNLEIISGDVFNPEQVENAIAGKDFVFSALSGRSSKPDYSVLSVGMNNIVSGMEKAGIKRILIVAGAGILDDSEYGLRRNRPNYPEIFKFVSAENWKVYEALQKTKLNWTLVCAPEMPEDKRTGNYRTAIDYLPVDGRRIAVEDVADFFLQNIRTEAIFQKRVGIAY
ncbi:MAG: SDR family oxidoreductase [Leptospiraceae bacterium]|nr:SDR family oxidoreductase [Leptospiraceae bacterium]